jgi:4-hydroxybenzoate polyprenyltransferase
LDLLQKQMEREIPVVFTEIATAEPVRERGSLRLLFTVIRPHQWVKNLFVLAPLLFGRRLTELTALTDATLAFAAFCLLSSAVYIFNDWWDAEDDRAHPEKRNRPISSGALPVSYALAAATTLLALGFAIAVLVGTKFLAVGILYAALMAMYCVALKRAIVLDAMTIAAGFVLRVLGGAVAVGVAATHWLIACTFLLALFLAFSKRRQELLTLEKDARNHREVLNHYSVPYLDSVINIVIGASIVCYALYTVAPETVARFGTDYLVYGTVFVVYGMLRYLALINDSSKGGNPSKLLLTDLPLLLTLSAWAIYNAAVIYRSFFEIALQ